MRAVQLRPAVLALIVAALVAAGCRPGEEAAPPGGPSPASPDPVPPEPDPSPTFPAPDLAAVSVQATTVAAMNQPVAFGYREGDDALYIAERVSGRVRVLRIGAPEPPPLVDLGGELSTGGEQGLLGIAFAGNQMYLNFTDRGGDTRVVEFGFAGEVLDPASRREILAVGQPFANHNGGHLVFGPDGHLWIGLGDGGSANDPQDNAQSLGTLLGKMLRIQPVPGDAPYAVPPDNPFVGTAGARGEIYALGLRNPWRYSFDRMTGDLWIGDVGQNAFEEINFMPAGRGAGANYGWARLEGTRPVRGTPPEGHIPPIFTYPLGAGRCAVIGGYLYRGTRIPGLHGAYLYSDNCDGRIRALVQEGGSVTQERDLGVVVPRMSSFGEGPDGEIYMLSLNGPVFRLDPR